MFSVLVIYKLHVNMYMALEKPKCDRCSFFLPLTQGYLGSYLSAWPGHPRVLSPDTPPSIPLCTNFSLWPHLTLQPPEKHEHRGRRQNRHMLTLGMTEVASEGGKENNGLCSGKHASNLVSGQGPCKCQETL